MLTHLNGSHKPKARGQDLLHKSGSAPTKPRPTHRLPSPPKPTKPTTSASAPPTRADAAAPSGSMPTVHFPLPASSPAPTSDIPHPTSPQLALPPSTEDRSRLTLLFRAQGDFVNFTGLIDEDPLTLLAWLAQPHIKPWADQIASVHRTHREAHVQQNLARALKEVTRILDLEANSTIRIRAVNNIVRLANAIDRSHRATENRQLHSPTAAHRSRAEGRANKEHHHANEARLNTEAMLDINQRRRAQNAIDLQDANAPVAAFPSWARDLVPLPAAGRDGVGLAETPSAPHLSRLTNNNGHHSSDKPHHLNGHTSTRNPQSENGARGIT